MRISDIVAQYILDMMEEGDGNAEIKRNELASSIGCVPSQINYVITSRFTPEQGYIVESRRGGGGYIRISRVKMDKNSMLMHIINSLGNHLDSACAEIIIGNIAMQGLISENAATLISTAVSDRCYLDIPPVYRDFLRASVLKNMLLTQI